MSTTPETIPTSWSVDDETFFRVAVEVFSPSFLQGAGLLLASYDPELSSTTAAAPATIGPARTEPAATSPLAA